MADKKISALTAATTPLAGTEVLPIVQSSATVKVSVANLTAGRNVDALSVTATTINGTTFDTNVAAAGVTLAGTTLSADGTDANINISIVPKGTGQIVVNAGTVSAPAIAPTGDSNTGVYFPAADTIAFAEGGVEAARIDSSANLLIGTSNNSDTAGDGIKLYPNNGGGPSIRFVGNTASAAVYPLMIRSSSSSSFKTYIDYAGNIYSVNTSIISLSDSRLKENVRDLETGLDKVLALQPRRFDWKEGKGQDKKDVAGFIAQEVELVLPEMVSTGVDENENGEKYKTIAPAMLIPTLVKAIQEQQATIESLKARLDAANL
jgi:hypothetical protein